MESLQNILKFILLGVLLAAPSGCASSQSDLDYTRKTVDTSAPDNSYHGWAAPPQEKDAPQTSQ